MRLFVMKVCHDCMKYNNYCTSFKDFQLCIVIPLIFNMIFKYLLKCILLGKHKFSKLI